MEEAKKSVILHPLSRGKDVEEMTFWKETEQEAAVLRQSRYLTLTALRERERQPDDANFRRLKKLFEKKLSKKFGGYEKSSYLCKRFRQRTEAERDSSLKDFR